MAKTFEICDGDIFESGCEMLVNPTVLGPDYMGPLAGVFARRFPGLEASYERDARAGVVRAGTFHLHEAPDEGHPERPRRVVVSLPTRDRLGEMSDIHQILYGLGNLARHLETRRGGSVALPALGTICSGLPWFVVAKAVAGWFAQDVPDGFTVKLYKMRPPGKTP